MLPVEHQAGPHLGCWAELLSERASTTCQHQVSLCILCSGHVLDMAEQTSQQQVARGHSRTLAPYQAVRPHAALCAQAGHCGCMCTLDASTADLQARCVSREPAAHIA